MTEVPLKLTIELIPTTCFGKNLRKAIPLSRWNKHRKEIFEAQNNKCCICGAGGKLHCHEEWSYDDLNLVQNLVGFNAICAKCHQVKHIGMSQKLEELGYVDLEEVVFHFMTVNMVSRSTYQNHYKESSRIFVERSRYQWKTDLGSYKYLTEAAKITVSNFTSGYEDKFPGLLPGADMPQVCPYCKEKGTLEFMDEESDEEMTDGEHSEYLSGRVGCAACNNCDMLVFFD